MHRISCRSLALALDNSGKAISLIHRSSGYDFLSSAACPAGLWRLGLIRPVSYTDPLPEVRIPEFKYNGHEYWVNHHEYRADLILDSDDAPAPVLEATAECLSLTWILQIDGKAGRLSIEISGGNDRDTLEFRISVEVPPEWKIKWATYPRLRGFGDLKEPEKDQLLWPENWGVLRHNPLEDMSNFTGQYPSGSPWCQMLAWINDGRGLYLAIQDPETNHIGFDAQYTEGEAPVPVETERWHIHDNGTAPIPHPYSPLSERIACGRKPAVQVRMHHWPAQSHKWESPYPVVLQGFGGGWYQAAQIHGKWATGQRWCRRGRLSGRKDVSPALANLDLWFVGYGFPPGDLKPKPAWEFHEAMLRLHEFFGMPFGVHWYNWHAFSWHTSFPSHSPAVEGFEEAVKDLQRRGIVVMPYCQGRLLYRDRPAIAQERTHASVEANGQPYLEMYTPQDDWPLALCPSDKWSQAQWGEAARMLWKKCGVEGVYFDQIAAMKPSLCYHTGHGHELGGGNHYWRGYDQALSNMESLKTEKAQRFIASECLADAFMDRIDLYLSFVPMLEDYVPLFSAIYGGYTLAMGRCTPDHIMADPQLFAICHGEQFLFGGQLGWVNDNILNHRGSAEFLRNLARLRSHVRDIIQEGNLAEPLKLKISGERLKLELPSSLTGKRLPIKIERDAVRHSIWKADDGRMALLFLNESTSTADVEFAPPQERPTDKWQLWRLGETQGERFFAGPNPARVAIPPLSLSILVAEH